MKISLYPDDKKLNAFEVNGKPLQFKRIPFRLTNTVVTQIINEDKLIGTYPYLDGVRVAGNTFKEFKDFGSSGSKYFG